MKQRHSSKRQPIKWAIALGLSGVIASSAAVPGWAAAVPANTAVLKSAVATDVIEIRSRGRRGGGGAGIAAGLAAGLLLGGLVAAPRYYGGPPPYYSPGYYGPVYGAPGYYGPVYSGPPDWIEYCFSRYRSFDPVSGTYLGYDGIRHVCR